MAKQVTNKELLEKIEKLEKQIDGMKSPVPYIVQNNHSHCTCLHCHPVALPLPYYQPYRPSIGPFYSMISAGTSTPIGGGNIS